MLINYLNLAVTFESNCILFEMQTYIAKQLHARAYIVI